jgi:hypothetical protein
MLEAVGVSQCAPKWLLISTTITGNVSAKPIQKRRVMSARSGPGLLPAAGISGSSAMPQTGQLPGPGWRICGCIGQV